VATLRSYALPFIGALALHTLVVLAFMQGVSGTDEIAQVITPTVVNAKLMVVEPPQAAPPSPAKPRAQAPKPAPKPVEKKAPAQPAAESKAKDTSPTAEEVAQAASAERQRKEAEAQRRRERLAALGELADDSLQRSLDAEAQQMQDDRSQQQVSSYQAGIYDLVRKNWSRPPSARNGMQARFVVELIPTGEVLSVALVDSSGNAAFDRAAEQAIRRARRFAVPTDNTLFEQNFRRFYFLFRPEDLLR
jgi:colicin import membrane protein